MSAWEDLCDNCGKCCSVFGSKFACPALDVKTNMCKRYKTRLTEQCCGKITPENVLTLHEQGLLPDTCAYVRHAKNKKQLENPEKVKLQPFYRAPHALRMKYYRARAKWLKENNNGEKNQ